MKPSDTQLTAKANSWRMFDAISEKYDLLNRCLSLGLDLQWRERLRHLLPEGNHLSILDVATGTADVLLTLVDQSNKVDEGFGIDLADKMLLVGQNKIEKTGMINKIRLKNGDATKIPFESETFDCTTIAFGIRNVEDPKAVLKQMHRVLKSKGRTLILEFSMPENPVIRFFHIQYLNWLVPSLGYMISGNFMAYKYLAQTIQNFPYGENFCQLMRECEFKNVTAHPLMFGVATIYQGDKS